MIINVNALAGDSGGSDQLIQTEIQLWMEEQSDWLSKQQYFLFPLFLMGMGRLSC